MRAFTAIAFVLSLVGDVRVAAFAPRSPAKQQPSPVGLCATTPNDIGSTASSSSTATAASTFPVLSRIAGVEWTGACRYVNAELVHAENLKLVGGLRYDIDTTDQETVTLSSFLTFPNGQRREVVMTNKGSKNEGVSTGAQMRLDSTAEEGGPIYMLLTELAPDTVLINEIEKATGNIIMTSSLSVVTVYNQGASETELVQVSHEVGGGDDAESSRVEGHQVWRLKKSKAKTIDGGDFDDFDEFDLRETTGR